MSIYHTAGEHIDVLAAPSRATTAAVSALRTAIFAAIDGARSVIIDRWTQRRLNRLSDHILRDFGFEREWDGTVHPLRDAD